MSNQSLSHDELKVFLMEANMQHAFGKGKVINENDGSRTIEFSQGDYKMHDNFFGGEPYGGRLVIFYKNEPVLIEVYYGKTSKPSDELYAFLREALQHPDAENSYRGPAEYKKGRLTYKSNVKGDIADHEVTEWIYEQETEIYSAKIIGGLVDQNAKNSM